jgi:hypothetical protein
MVEKEKFLKDHPNMLYDAENSDHIYLWAKQYGDINQLLVRKKGSSETKENADTVETWWKCYIRNPNRQELMRYMTVYSEDKYKGNELLLNTCWLDGDNFIRDDNTSFISALLRIDQIVGVVETALKKSATVTA